MPYGPHILFTFGGTMNGGPEIWQTGFKLGIPGGGEPAMVNPDVLAPLAGTLQDWGGTIGAFTNVKLGFIKANRIGGNGKYQDPTTVQLIIDPEVELGTAGSGFGPYQVTQALSFTAAGRGPGTRGRMYFPSTVLAMDVGADGLMSTAGADDVLAASKTMIDQVITSLDQDGLTLVLTARNQIVAAVNPVTELRMGLVPDTQRRRRNKLPESYRELAFS